MEVLCISEHTYLNGDLFKKMRKCKMIEFTNSFSGKLDFITDNVESVIFNCTYLRPLYLPDFIKFFRFIYPRYFLPIIHLSDELRKLEIRIYPENGTNWVLNLKKLKYLDINLTNVSHFNLYEFPESIKNLGIYHNKSQDFNDELIIDFTILPKKLKVLNLKYCNSPIYQVPITLQYLHISCYKFNESLSTLKNTNIRKIRLNCPNFDKPLIDLPQSLVSLEILGRFNQKLDNLPQKLRKLEISSESFNQPMDNLPILKKLVLECAKFSYGLDYLPITLQELVLYLQRDFSIDNLPVNLRKLVFKSYDCKNDFRYLPLNIESIFLKGIDYSRIIFPPNVKIIGIECEEKDNKINYVPSFCYPYIYRERVDFKFPESVHTVYTRYKYIGELREKYPKIKFITDV